MKVVRFIARLCLIAANAAAGIAMVLAAYAGTLDSEAYPVAAIWGMTYPVWVPLMLLLGIADAFWARKSVIWVALVFAVTLPMTVRTIPVNIPRGAVPDTLKPDSWTFMTYNVAGFTDLSGRSEAATPNTTLNYILARDPDVVVLQEVSSLEADDENGVTTQQIDSLNHRYPHIFVGTDVTMLSRFPAERLEEADEFFIDPAQPAIQHAGVFVLTIKGEKVLVVGTHLKSIGLTDDDKELYEELTRGKGLTTREEINAVKTDLLSKLSEANKVRGGQAKKIVNLIDSLGIRNVIVAGDFNDVPGCFAYRSLEKTGLKAVYPMAGSGYKMTFHADRFYFMIDHVFVRGVFKPWSIYRGSLKSSDHYPLTVTFVKD